MKPLLSEKEIHAGVQALAAHVARDFQGRPLTILGVLTGSLVLVADLIRQLDLPLQVGFIQTRSYRGAATTPGELTINSSMLPELRGRAVLLVDDIFDTGRTLAALIDKLWQFEPASISSAVLLVKQGRQEVVMRPDYTAFEIPDAFVVGYGLDYQDAYRNLPYLAQLEAADLSIPHDAMPSVERTA